MKYTAIFAMVLLAIFAYAYATEEASDLEGAEQFYRGGYGGYGGYGRGFGGGYGRGFGGYGGYGRGYGGYGGYGRGYGGRYYG